MTFLKRNSHFLPLFYALLIVFAWPIAVFLSKTDYEIFYYSNCICWLIVAFIAIFHYRPPLKKRIYFSFILALFFWSALPSIIYHSSAIGAFSIAFLASGLFIYSLRLDGPLSPYLAELHNTAVRIADKYSNRIWILGFFFAFLGLAISFSWFCFHFLPAYDDSIAQYVHSKVMAGGHLYSPSHPLKNFFYIKLTLNDIHNRWYSQYQPLHLFLLAFGHFMGMPWIINPLMGALTGIVIYKITQRLYDDKTAKIASILYIGSIWILSMSSEYMSHPTALLLVGLFLWSFIETLERLTQKQKHLYRWAFLCGLSLGAIFLVRPLVTFQIGAPFIGYYLFLLIRQPALYLKPLFYAALGISLCILVQGWYDYELTGDIFFMPYARNPGHFSSEEQQSFFKGLYKTLDTWAKLNASYSFPDALSKVHREWSTLNYQIFDWPIPSTFFVMILCLRSLKTCYERLMIGILCSYLFFNMLYQFSNFAWGPRYVYETSLPIIILSAASIRRLPSAPILYFHAMSGAVKNGIIILLISLYFISGLFFRLPNHLERFSHFFHNDPKFYQSIVTKTNDPALVFIRESKKGEQYYKVAFTDPPDDKNPVIFARDRGDKENRKLMDYYPGRTVYIEINRTLYLIRDPQD